MRLRHLVAVLVFCLAGVSLLAQASFWAQEKQKPTPKAPAAPETSAAAAQAPHVFTISPEDSARKNPEKFTEASVEHGKKLFQSQCAMCHGMKGDGKGEMAEEMHLSLPDFTKPETFKKRTDGALFTIIGVGSDVMPGQANRMSDRHRWQIVNFLRATAGQKPEKSTEKEEEDENTVVAPR